MPSPSSDSTGTFIELNPSVLLLNPDSAQRANLMHPSVVLLFGWLNAQLPYLRKYAEPLRSAFPTSIIILVKATTAWYFTSGKRLEMTLMPVVDIIRKETSESAPFRGVLVHVLSNGGGFQLVTLRKVLAKMPNQDREQIPRNVPTALILDSTPAANGLSSAINSWAPSQPILHNLAIPPISILYAAFYMINGMCGNPPIFDELRATLNSPNLLPSITHPANPEATPRLYIYSDKDSVTKESDVVSHSKEALSNGFSVSLEKFSGTAHVAHSRSDPERYWNAVSSLWIRALPESFSVSMQSSL